MAPRSGSPSTHALPSITPLICLLPLLLSSSLLPRSTSQSTSQEDEKRTLLKIKAEWGNPPALSSWINSGGAAGDHCNWAGILCTNGSVAEISLPEQNITGPIPPAICDLKNLSLLDLHYNNLSGPFPTTLYNCSNLEYLDISQNLFVGAIPADIYRMSSRLTNLSLSSNNFTGNIPPSIGRLPAIRSLFLDNNLFNRSFPAELGNLSALETLTLAYNPFTPARIPPEFGNLTKLSYLWMTKMNLFGEIPESLGNLVELEHLDLAWNSLNGTIPGWIWKLEKLEYLYLFANKFSGEISGSIRALSLVELDISINQLTGSIPEDIGKLKNLTILFMYYNRLSGEIPASIGLLPNLQDIRFFRNNLTGVLPPELGKHSPLLNLEVQWNSISGELPEYLCAGKALTSLNVFDNNFTGEVPASLGDCSTLDNIQLYRNAFSGEFPAGIWSAVNLTTVIIHHNLLSGTLPDELPRKLTRLEMENNRFSGTIPSTAKNLAVFRASNNLFSGEIPGTLAGISRLQKLSLGGNQISGSIPPAISALTSLAVLNLSDNRLSGEIPAELGSLPVLTSLDLSGNQLSGEIPQAIGNLTLSFLNLSSNQLSGEIPTSLQNQAYERSFLANPGLCSSSNSIKNLHTCGYRSNGSDKLSKGLLVLCLLLGAAFFLAVVVIGYLMAREHRRRMMDGDDHASWKLTSFHAVDFTEYNIVPGLTESNSIGSGGSGKVYRVVLGDRAEEEIVAVKKIWSNRKLDSKLEKEFQAEVQILGSIRHVNIVKLLCCISSDDSKLLVYEYMENGNLNQWLHRLQRTDRGSERSNPLDWPTRLGIAIGAARGLCYMHHDCSPPIVHRDVKSSNILLDAEFGAKIADFGLARILATGGEPESVSAIAGSFGYMAPECGYLRKVNEKVDVYSFGVVLFELVTGRGANDGGEHECLAEWAWRHYQEGGRVIDIIDEEIQDPLLYLDEMEVVFRLGLFCTGRTPSSRPSMKEVLQVLAKCDRRLEHRNMLYGRFDTAPLLQTKKGSRHESLLSEASERGDGNYVAGLV